MSETECPKSMTFGPCGGVRADLSCEVDARPCPFLHGASVPRAAATRAPVPPNLPAPIVAVDVRAPSQWDGDVRALWGGVGDALQGCVALLGEHVDNIRREDDSGALDPVAVVEILAGKGVPVIVTVTGRDRTLSEARRDMARYLAAGAAAIHCVTGDHPAAMGIARAARFGAEAATLITEAVAAGATATVGESPASPGDRVERLLLKQSRGASACILNHHGSVDEMVAFADACTARGLDLALVAPVPMIGDARSALALTRFPGLRVWPDALERVMNAAEPEREGRAVVLEMAGGLAESGRFAGVNLSGSTAAADPWERVRIAGELAQRVRERWRASSTGSSG
jgi:5,10-methylenetetrahydrofolate reductase